MASNDRCGHQIGRQHRREDWAGSRRRKISKSIGYGCQHRRKPRPAHGDIRSGSSSETAAIIAEELRPAHGVKSYVSPSDTVASIAEEPRPANGVKRFGCPPDKAASIAVEPQPAQNFKEHGITKAKRSTGLKDRMDSEQGQLAGSKERSADFH